MVDVMTWTVAIVEDHSLVREGLNTACQRIPGVSIVYSGSSISQTLALPDAPDVVLLDLDLGGKPVTEDDAQQLIDRGSSILVVSALGSPATVRAMIRAGAAGFVSKRDSVDELVHAIQAVLDGGQWTTPELAAVIVRDPQRPNLSAQERRALELYASGLKMQSVARQMGVQPTTAKEYIERVRAKYTAIGRPAPTKTHLTRNAQQDGVLEN